MNQPVNGPTTLETSTLEQEHDNCTLECPYWDGIFSDAEKPIEWLLDWSSAGLFFIPFLPTTQDSLTLAIGTGNSSFPEALHKKGYCPQLIASDFSATVIATMKKQQSQQSQQPHQSQQQQGLTYEVQDARNLTYKNNTADVVIDKSLLDCMYWAENRTDAISPMIQEVYRVLKNGGTALFMTQRDPSEVLPFFSTVAWENVSFIPLAAKTDDNGDVVPGCPTCLEHRFDDYYDETEFYELIFLYVCIKPVHVTSSSIPDQTKILSIVPCKMMNTFENMPPTNTTGLKKRTRSTVFSDTDDSGGDGDGNEDDGDGDGDDDSDHDGHNHRKKRRVTKEEAKEEEEEDDNDEKSQTTCPLMCAFANSVPDLVAWGKAFKLEEQLEKNNGIVVIDDFLPSEAALEVRELLQTSDRSIWKLNADDGDDDDTPHQFLSASANSDPGFSAATRAIWSLMTDHLPSFSAARYNTSDHIALHDDALIVKTEENALALYRDVAIVLYMVDDAWTASKDGGVLLDWGPTNSKFQTPTEIPAKFNRLVCFRVPRWHEVTPVVGHTADEERPPRLSIFGWFLTEQKLY